MSIVLITGGNKGIGYETAKRLIQMGHKVYIGCRDEARGKAAAQELGAEQVQIDVTQDDSVNKAAEYLQSREDHIDICNHKAGDHWQGWPDGNLYQSAGRDTLVRL